jgi:LPS export ABC transporter protein LptC
MTMTFARLLPLVALLTAACNGAGRDPVVADESLQQMAADQVLYDVVHYMTTDGTRRAELHADSVYAYEDSARVELWNPRLTMFNERGERSAEVTGLRGTMNTRTQAMTMRQNVVLITVEGNRRIETEELHFDERADRVWSEVATTMIEGGTTMHGEGFTSDSRMRNLQVTRPRGRVEGMRIDF